MRACQAYHTQRRDAPVQYDVSLSNQSHATARCARGARARIPVRCSPNSTACASVRHEPVRGDATAHATARCACSRGRDDATARRRDAPAPARSSRIPTQPYASPTRSLDSLPGTVFLVLPTPESRVPATALRRCGLRLQAFTKSSYSRGQPARTLSPPALCRAPQTDCLCAQMSSPYHMSGAKTPLPHMQQRRLQLSDPLCARHRRRCVSLSYASSNHSSCTSFFTVPFAALPPLARARTWTCT